MTILKVKSKKNKFSSKLISRLPLLDQSIFNSGPVQFYFPEAFKENVEKLKEKLTEFEFNTEIYFAHKSNKSKVFVNEALDSKINIDVASVNELYNALKIGYQGNQIECTGIKNEEFIKESIKNNCLIVIDSLSELNLIKKLISNNVVRLLIRISNIFPEKGDYKRVSRFGILKEDFMNLIENNELRSLKIEGLHIHYDEYVPENKSRMISELLSLYKILYKNNIFPSKINIGGGYRYPIVDESEVDKVIEDIEKIDFSNVAYAKTIMGFERGRNGNLSKTQVRDKIYPQTSFKFLKDTIEFNKENEELIEDLNLKLLIEPGYALLDNCGVMVMRVIGTKKLDANKNGIIVDGNMYNLSSQMKKWVTDPELIKNKNNNLNESYEGYILGNLCKEDDILIDRKIKFEKTPEIGDLIVFHNTAGYAGSFEDTNAILQPTVKNYVITNSMSDELKLKSEEKYLEETNDN